MATPLRNLGIQDAMSRLGLSRARVKQLAKHGRIGQSVAGRYLFSAQELAAFSAIPRSAGRPKVNGSKTLRKSRKI